MAHNIWNKFNQRIALIIAKIRMFHGSIDTTSDSEQEYIKYTLCGLPWDFLPVTYICTKWEYPFFTRSRSLECDIPATCPTNAI